MPHTIRSNYFSDGKTIIDFILVISPQLQNDKKHLNYMLDYVENLQKLGLRFEATSSTINEDRIFIKINLSSKAVRHFAKVYNIDIRNRGHRYFEVLHAKEVKWPRFETCLTANHADLFKRKKKRAISMERIMIAKELLYENMFSTKSGHILGLGELLELGIVKNAYPLHDGPFHFEGMKDSELNDRQLLLKYWANFSLWYKKQPLNLIEKYYGTEVAFYFAWLGFYNKMLIPASIVGVICFISSCILLPTHGRDLLHSLCKTDRLYCRFCEDPRNCDLDYLRNSCTAAKFAFLFDNGITICFSIFMSFWATVFICGWAKFEGVLKITWHVESYEANNDIQSSYKKKATIFKKSWYSGEIEPWIPWHKKILYTTITFGITLILLSIVCFVIAGLIIYRINVSDYLTHHKVMSPETAGTVGLITTSILQVIFIKLFGQVYTPLCMWLTRIENPRTQNEFDKAYIHKRYVLGFANNYAPLFYIAFVKGRLYFPYTQDGSSLGLKTDVCHPSGCALALCVQLAFCMVLKSMAGNIMTLIKPQIKGIFRGKRKKSINEDLPQYEVEFDLESADEYLLTSEYLEMIIQFGFVTFFVTAFPLAPLCALINNVMELRLDAYKFVTRHRRPVPKKHSGIGTWNRILTSMTWLSTIINAFVLAFTSDFVSKAIYFGSHGDYKNYFDEAFSEFELWPANENPRHGNKTNICYYRGHRYPPNHPNAYQYTPYHYFEMGMKFTCVVVFEMIVISIKGIVQYLVPTYSSQVIEELQRSIQLKAEERVARKEKHDKARIVIRKSSV